MHRVVTTAPIIYRTSVHRHSSATAPYTTAAAQCAYMLSTPLLPSTPTSQLQHGHTLGSSMPPAQASSYRCTPSACCQHSQHSTVRSCASYGFPGAGRSPYSAASSAAPTCVVGFTALRSPSLYTPSVRNQNRADTTYCCCWCCLLLRLSGCCCCLQHRA
jgi:hypothetical protein